MSASTIPKFKWAAAEKHISNLFTKFRNYFFVKEPLKIIKKIHSAIPLVMSNSRYQFTTFMRKFYRSP